MKKLLIALVGMMTVLPGCDWCCWRRKKCCDKKEMRSETPMRKKCCRKETNMRHHDHDME